MTKVALSLLVSMFACLHSRAGWSSPAAVVVVVGALGTQAIVLREVTGRSDPKSMRKQLCCSKLYFCQAGSSERSWDIRNPKWEDR